jgi:hypothetical protein
MMYQLVNDPMTKNLTCIKRLSDNSYIPLDPANTDYQQYLEWISILGNEALPPDPQPE